MAVYRVGGRQLKRSAATFAQAREIKRGAEARVADDARGPTVHAYALAWVDAHAGAGYDTVREFTRREYRRLLITYALAYFDSNARVADLDRYALHGFVNWLTLRRGRDRRLRDRSIANAITPLRGCLTQAAADGLLDEDALIGLLPPRRRGGGPWRRPPESRFLTHDELRRVLAEIPPEWRTFFDLLASTGLRISEAIALQWGDLSLADQPPEIRVRRAMVRGVIGPPKSWHGVRNLPISPRLTTALDAARPAGASADALVFTRADGTWVRPDYLRRIVLAPAAERAGVAPLGFHAFRHTFAAMLIARNASALALQRQMGHHSAAYTYEAYGHLIDGRLSLVIDLDKDLAAARGDNRSGALDEGGADNAQMTLF